MNPEGCSFDLTPTEASGEDEFVGKLGVSCPAGKSIKVVASNCSMEVKAQSGLSSVSLANDTASNPERVGFDPEVTNLAYTVTNDGFLCPFSGTGSKTGGTLKAGSPIMLAAERDGEGVDIRLAE